MGFFSWARSLFGSDTTPAGSAFMSQIFPAGKPPARGTRQLLLAYRSLPWLHTVVHKVATDVAGARFHLYRQKNAALPPQTRMLLESRRRDVDGSYQLAGADEVTDHDFLELLKKPNPVLQRRPLFSVVQSYLDIKGEAPIMLERDTKGFPLQLWPTPPHWLIRTPSESQPSYHFNWNSFVRDVPEGDVAMLAHPDLDNPYARGAGTAEALADELDIDEFAAKHIAAYFYNRAVPDVFVSMKNVRDEKLAERFEEKLRNKYRGSSKAWQVHVTNAEIDIKPVSQNFKDMLLGDLRQAQRDTIIQVFGVPPEICGIVQNSNRATASAADFIYTSRVLAPRMTFLADALTLIAQEWDERFFVAFESPVAEDAQFRLEVMSAQPSLFTKNEWRELARLAPRAGWDEQFANSTPGAAPGTPGLPGAPVSPDGITPALEPGDESPEDPELDDDEEAKSARPRLVAGG